MPDDNNGLQMHDSWIKGTVPISNHRLKLRDTEEAHMPHEMLKKITWLGGICTEGVLSK